MINRLFRSTSELYKPYCDVNTIAGCEGVYGVCFLEIVHLSLGVHILLVGSFVSLPRGLFRHSRSSPVSVVYPEKNRVEGNRYWFSNPFNAF
jgi:hypothetical protein